MHLLAAETCKVQNLITFFILLLFGMSTADYFAHRCLKTTYTTGNPYQTNRIQILSSLRSNGSLTGFHNSTVGIDPDTVYGRAICRGDLPPSNCSTCLAIASSQLLQLCDRSRDAIIWFDECHLVYYSHKFVFNISTRIRTGGYSDFNVSDLAAFYAVLEPVLSNLVTKVLSSSSFYAAEVNFTHQPWIYAMAQCCRDLSNVECNACLTKALAFGKDFGLNARGVRALYDSCNVRYEVYPFFQALQTPTAQSPTSPANGGLADLEGEDYLDTDPAFDEAGADPFEDDIYP